MQTPCRSNTNPIKGLMLIPHRAHADPLQIPERFNTNPTGIPHKHHTDPMQILLGAQHHSHTGPMQIHYRSHSRPNTNPLGIPYSHNRNPIQILLKVQCKSNTDPNANPMLLDSNLSTRSMDLFGLQWQLVGYEEGVPYVDIVSKKPLGGWAPRY